MAGSPRKWLMRDKNGGTTKLNLEHEVLNSMRKGML